MSETLMTVRGLASKTSQSLKVSLEDLEQGWSLLDFLRQRGLPVASSCGGEGICLACMVNEDLLSCQIQLKHFIQSGKREITITYL